MLEGALQNPTAGVLRNGFSSLGKKYSRVAALISILSMLSMSMSGKSVIWMMAEA